MKKKILSSIVFILAAAGAFIAYNVWGAAAKVPEGKYLYIHTGSNLGDVKKMLKEKGVLKNTDWFNRVAGWKDYKSVKPGRYEIKSGMSIYALVRMLQHGQQSPVNFVITKIRTKETFAKKAGSTLECDSLQMITFLSNNDSLKKYGLDTNTVMSVVMPDTYTYFWNTTPEKIFQKLYAAHQRFWTEERKLKAAKQGVTPLEAITVASIIDEETNAPSDRPNIASVYLNRVKKGMPLGADPTIKFALKDFALKQILYEHLKVQSPYNTYLNKGLPPGPICTPQPGTIDAVLDAPQTDYLFFVANSKFNGTHLFTTNLSDHEKLADLYRKEFKRRKDSVNKIQQPAQ
jgi:UPF0755 protein